MENSLRKNLTGTKILSEELSDVIFVAICLANQTGINLGDNFEKIK